MTVLVLLFLTAVPAGVVVLTETTAVEVFAVVEVEGKPVPPQHDK
jgi:hypothetical protein